MSIITDTFTDTDGTLLQAHSDGAGNSWTKGVGSFSTSNLQIQSNAVQGTTSFDTHAYAFSAQPTTADYKVRATFAAAATGATSLGLLLRYDPATGNGYSVTFNEFTGHYRMSRLDGGVATIIADSGASAPATVMEFRVSGTTFTVAKDGVDQLSTSDGTYSGAAFGGIFADSTGNPKDLVWDSFEIEATAFSGGSGPTSSYVFRSFRTSPRRR